MESFYLYFRPLLHILIIYIKYEAMRQNNSTPDLGNHVLFCYCKTMIRFLYARPSSELSEAQNEDIFFIINLLFEMVQTEMGDISDGISTSMAFRKAIKNGNLKDVDRCLSIHSLTRGQLIVLITHILESPCSLSQGVVYVKSFPNEIS